MNDSIDVVLVGKVQDAVIASNEIIATSRSPVPPARRQVGTDMTVGEMKNSKRHGFIDADATLLGKWNAAYSQERALRMGGHAHIAHYAGT